MTFFKSFAPQRTIQKNSLKHIQVLLWKRTKGKVLHLSLHREPQRASGKLPRTNTTKTELNHRRKSSLKKLKRQQQRANRQTLLFWRDPQSIAHSLYKCQFRLKQETKWKELSACQARLRLKEECKCLSNTRMDTRKIVFYCSNYFLNRKSFSSQVIIVNTCSYRPCTEVFSTRTQSSRWKAFICIMKNDFVTNFSTHNLVLYLNKLKEYFPIGAHDNVLSAFSHMCTCDSYS